MTRLRTARGLDRTSSQALEEVVEGGVGSDPLTLGDDRAAAVLAEIADVVEAEPEAQLRLRQATLAGKVGVDGQHLDPVPLGVLDQHARVGRNPSAGC